MKKLLSLACALGLVFTLSACDFDAGDIVDDGKAPVSNASSQGLEQSSVPQENPASQGQVTSTNSQVSQTASGGQISRERAIEIALNHAGLKQAEVINLTAELDRDPTHTEWEVEFDKDNFEYSYEINAQNGKIIKSEKEFD